MQIPCLLRLDTSNETDQFPVVILVVDVSRWEVLRRPLEAELVENMSMQIREHVDPARWPRNSQPSATACVSDIAFSVA
jgi:hypothetical protein